MYPKNRIIVASLVALATHISVFGAINYADVNVTVNKDVTIEARPISGCEIDTVIEFDLTAGERTHIRLPISGETSIIGSHNTTQLSSAKISFHNSNIRITSADQFRNGKYSLYTVNGREILNGSIDPNGQASLTLSSLAQGIFLLKVYKGSNVLSAKISNQISKSGVSLTTVKRDVKSVVKTSFENEMVNSNNTAKIVYNFDIATKDSSFYSKNTQHFEVSENGSTDISLSLERRDPSLRDLAIESGIKFGTAYGYRNNVDHDKYEQQFLNHFSSLTTEWGLPFSECRRDPQASVNDPSKWNLDHAERVVEFGRDNDIPVTAHHLIWHYWHTAIDSVTGKEYKDLKNDYLLPEWVLDSTYSSKSEIFKLMKDHITTLMTHFKENYPGVIREWSVVNEVASNNFNGFCPSFWYDNLGAEYLDSAFVWAHQADPEAKLIYNEYFYGGASYGGLRMPHKVDFTFNKVKGLLDRGIPVHAVGLQTHLSDKTFKKSVFEADLKRFTDLGIEVLITELDVQLAKPKTNKPYPEYIADATPETYQKQAEVYKSVMEVVLNNDKCNTLTVWGFNDAQTFSVSVLKQNFDPTICDSLYVPKPAWYGLRDAFLEHQGNE